MNKYLVTSTKERRYRMKGAIVEGRVISLPKGVGENDLVTVWNYCMFVRSRKPGTGKIYFRNNGKWKQIATDVRIYYVGVINRIMPCYYEKYGYAIYQTKTPGYFILDCITGKNIYHGEFDIDDFNIKAGMSDDHSNSCFLIKKDATRGKKFKLLDSRGKKVFEEDYIEFLNKESFDGLRLLTIRTNKSFKLGLIRYFSDECKEILPNEYDGIHLGGIVKDKYGNFHYPTIEAKKGDEHIFFDINGSVIEA